MENFHYKYRTEKNKLLEMISCCEHKGAIKKQKEKLKEIKKFTKIKIKDYKEELIEELCKSQRKDLRKFLKKERNKIKQIAKYAKVFKFPCGNCCEKNKVK